MAMDPLNQGPFYWTPLMDTIFSKTSRLGQRDSCLCVCGGGRGRKGGERKGEGEEGVVR